MDSTIAAVSIQQQRMKNIFILPVVRWYFINIILNLNDINLHLLAEVLYLFIQNIENYSIICKTILLKNSKK